MAKKPTGTRTYVVETKKAAAELIGLALMVRHGLLAGMEKLPDEKNNT